MNRLDTVQAKQPCNHNKERGATMVEYALMVALIAVAIIGAVTFLGTSISTQMSSVGQQVN